MTAIEHIDLLVTIYHYKYVLKIYLVHQYNINYY